MTFAQMRILLHKLRMQLLLVLLESGFVELNICSFEGNRIDAMRQMILADDEAARRKALKKLLPYQRRDFQGIFKALEGKPATIRLLDPPLHEFLPHDLRLHSEI